jgi:hypothetical protein
MEIDGMRSCMFGTIIFYCLLWGEGGRLKMGFFGTDFRGIFFGSGFEKYLTKGLWSFSPFFLFGL